MEELKDHITETAKDISSLRMKSPPGQQGEADFWSWCIALIEYRIECLEDEVKQLRGKETA